MIVHPRFEFQLRVSSPTLTMPCLDTCLRIWLNFVLIHGQQNFDDILFHRHTVVQCQLFQYMVLEYSVKHQISQTRARLVIGA